MDMVQRFEFFLFFPRGESALAFGAGLVTSSCRFEGNGVGTIGCIVFGFEEKATGLKNEKVRRVIYNVL